MPVIGLFEVGRAQTLQAVQRRDDADAAYAHAEAIPAMSLGNDHPRTLRVCEMRAGLAAQQTTLPLVVIRRVLAGLPGKPGY